MQKPCTRSKSGLWVMAVSALVLLTVIYFAATSKMIASKSVVGTGEVITKSSVNSVPPEMLPSLLIGPDDLPWDAVLFSLTTGTGVTKYRFASLKNSLALEEKWFGPPSGDPGSLKTAHYGAKIVIALADSSEEAASVALKQVSSAAVVNPEITGASSFADRAWYGDNAGGESAATSAGMTFVRGNVVCLIHLSHKDGVATKQVYTLASRLSSKIDAALQGKPEPVPILPLAADGELRVDLECASKMRDLGPRLWGNESKTIAICDANGIPRSLPAKQVAAHDYVVPLRHIAAIIGPRARVKIMGDEANTTLMGKTLVLSKAKAQMKVGQNSAQLDRSVEFSNEEVLVPLKSLMNNAMGKSIAWETRGNIRVGRIQ